MNLISGYRGTQWSQERGQESMESEHEATEAS